MKIEDVMSENLIVGWVPGTVKDALKILAKHNVSGMPILKKETKTVVGVLFFAHGHLCITKEAMRMVTRGHTSQSDPRLWRLLDRVMALGATLLL